jgi:uncharacterized membrane protein
VDIGQIFATFLPALEAVPWLRAGLAIILVFFLPGLAWTLVLFQHINIIERLALAIGLSIASVTLGILLLNVLFDVRINGVNAVLTILAITAAGVAVYFIRRLLRRPADADVTDV